MPTMTAVSREPHRDGSRRLAVVLGTGSRYSRGTSRDVCCCTPRRPTYFPDVDGAGEGAHTGNAGFPRLPSSIAIWAILSGVSATM